MQREELQKWKTQEPFQPFRVHRKDGQTYDVRSRFLFLVLRSYLLIGIPEPNETEPIYDYVVTMDYSEITAVTPLSESATTVP